MPGYDYGNARLRAMKARLLPVDVLIALSEAASIDRLISILTETNYRKSMEYGLARADGYRAFVLALRREHIDSLGKIKRFFDGSARDDVMVLLMKYDVQNLRAILRGVTQNLPPEEILDALQPVGELPIGILERLAQSVNQKTLLDLLATLRIEIAKPLLSMRDAIVFESESFELARKMERELMKAYYTQALDYARSRGRKALLLREMLSLEADIDNMMIALRFAYAPGERRGLISEGLSIQDVIRQYFVGPGNLSFQILLQTAECDSLEEAVNVLMSVPNPFSKGLRAGLETFHENGWLGELERKLRSELTRKKSRDMVLDPLGIGIPIGYLALKNYELRNLRWIGRSITHNISPQIIREGLELLT